MLYQWLKAYSLYFIHCLNDNIHSCRSKSLTILYVVSLLYIIYCYNIILTVSNTVSHGSDTVVHWNQCTNLPLILWEWKCYWTWRPLKFSEDHLWRPAVAEVVGPLPPDNTNRQDVWLSEIKCYAAFDNVALESRDPSRSTGSISTSSETQWVTGNRDVVFNGFVTELPSIHRLETVQAKA